MSETSYKVLITTAGREKLAQALAAGTTVKLKQLALGDGNGKPVSPAETQTALVREVYRGDMLTCEPLASAPENIVCVMAIPASAGGWSVREIGVFDADGELFAVGNIAEAYKPAPSEGTSREMLLRCIIGIGATDAVELVTDPTQVIATQEYVKNAINEMIHGITELGNELREWAELIGKYEYKVVTREEYDEIVAAGAIEEDVIYFVKGTKEFAAIFEELTQKITANEESITALKTEHDSEVKEINARLDAGDSVDANLFTKITELEYKHKEDIDTQEIALEQIREEIEKNRTDLNTLTENISASGTTVDEKLSEVESRLTANLEAIALEKASEAVAQETSLREQSEKTIADSITQLTEKTNDNAAGITEHENRITQLEADVSELSDGQQDWIQATSEALSTANSNLAAEITRSTEKDESIDAMLEALEETSSEHARSETGVLNNPVLINAWNGTWQKQMSPEISDNANMHGWYGTLGDWGITTDKIVPVAITLYRRTNSAKTNTTALRYLRILRRSADGTTWTVAYESTNGNAPNAFSENDAMTWTLKNVDGRGPIPASEEIIVTQVGDRSLIATANVMWGAKCTGTIAGAMPSATIPTDATAAITVQDFAPAMDVEYYVAVSVPETFATLLDEIAQLKEANATLAERIEALETSASAALAES